MYTTPPTTGFIVLSIIGILLIATIPFVGFALYGNSEVYSPPVDSVGDSVINNQNDTP